MALASVDGLGGLTIGRLAAELWLCFALTLEADPVNSCSMHGMDVG